MMRLIAFLIPLLCACSTPTVRCDAHLQRINPPGVSDVPGAAVQGAPARRAP
jgi:hypothetical protein